MRFLRSCVLTILLVLAVAASAMLISGALDSSTIPAPRQAPVPLTSVIDR
jgi:hypothetical protein